jgi:molybdopterin-guanine dinucleotide biosynthesis protein A
MWKTPENRAGWILTGGRSSRMGADKALLEIEGRALAARVADALSPVCGTVSLVGDPARYGHLGLRVVPDAFPGEGPLAGIEAALAATSAEKNLIVACDMPALHPETLESLFAVDADIAVPQYEDGRLEPLCSVFTRRCHPAIREALESGIRRVTDALRHLESGGFELRYLRVADCETFRNLNTPEDLAAYRKGNAAEAKHG